MGDGVAVSVPYACLAGRPVVVGAAPSLDAWDGLQIYRILSPTGEWGTPVCYRAPRLCRVAADVRAVVRAAVVVTQREAAKAACLIGAEPAYTRLVVGVG